MRTEIGGPIRCTETKALFELDQSYSRTCPLGPVVDLQEDRSGFPLLIPLWLPHQLCLCILERKVVEKDDG